VNNCNLVAARSLIDLAASIGIGGISQCHPSHTTGHTGPYHGGSADWASTMRTPGLGTRFGETIRSSYLANPVSKNQN
jgi:hypothetical protein